jgi:cytidylate kinase
MNKPLEIPGTRIITVSGRIGAGSTSLAKSLAKLFNWKHLEGGEIFWEAVRKRMGLDPKDTNLRPDEEDRLFDEQLKKILREDRDIVLETKLAGFNAQGMGEVFKILVICEDKMGIDQTAIRIDRLVNREHVSVDDAKQEVVEREKNDLEKWRNIYAAHDTEWVYYDPKYYDLVINTFTHNAEESVKMALAALRLPQ